jgi:hypothetical protein
VAFQWISSISYGFQVKLVSSETVCIRGSICWLAFDVSRCVLVYTDTIFYWLLHSYLTTRSITKGHACIFYSEYRDHLCVWTRCWSSNARGSPFYLHVKTTYMITSFHFRGELYTHKKHNFSLKCLYQARRVRVNVYVCKWYPFCLNVSMRF